MNYPLRIAMQVLIFKVIFLFTIFLNLSTSWAQGLYGEYFNSRNFNDDAPLIRVDPQINFNWGNGAPFEGVRENRFSIRWRGWFVPCLLYTSPSPRD